MGVLFVADGVIMNHYFALQDKKRGLKHNPFVTGFSIVLVRHSFTFLFSRRFFCLYPGNIRVWLEWLCDRSAAGVYDRGGL
jgi:hypothetical protein